MRIFCSQTTDIKSTLSQLTAKFFITFFQVFQGNINYYAPIRRKIEKPFLALSVRFVVKTWHTNICLRAEIYGCYPGNFTSHLRLFSIRWNFLRETEVFFVYELSDTTYCEKTNSVPRGKRRVVENIHF